MNQNELHKHICFDILIIVFTIVSFIFSLVMILTDNVSASTVTTDITNSISIPTTYSGCTQSNGKYWGDDGSSTTCKVHNVKTTISGVLYSLEFILKNAWVINEPAFVQINGMSSDFRNNDLYCELTNSSNASVPCDITFNSKSQLQITFVPTSTGNYTLGIYSSSYSAITGVNTYGIKSVVVRQQTGDNADIINNQNQNTEDIINNNNENTQDIVNSINGGAIAMVEGFSCPVGPLAIVGDEWVYYEHKMLNDSGQLVNSNDYDISPFLSIKPNTEYTIKLPGAYTNPSYCFYTGKATNRTISCVKYNGRTNITFTTPSNANYLLLTFYRPGGVYITGPICNNWEVEKIEIQNQLIQDELDYIQDDSDPTINDSDITDTMGDVAVANPLEYFLTLPTTLLSKIQYAIDNNSCTPVSLGRFGSIGRHDLSGYEFKLPCVDIKAKIGDSLYNTIDLIVAIGLLTLTIYKLYVSISNMLTLGAEDEVKSHIIFLTPMEFLANIIGAGGLGVFTNQVRGNR